MEWEIGTILFSVAVVTGVIVRSVIQKKRGKSGCGCDCSNCGFACPSKRGNVDENTNLSDEKTIEEN